MSGWPREVTGILPETEPDSVGVALCEIQSQGPLSYRLKPFRDVSKAILILTKPTGFLFLLFFPLLP